MSVIVMGMEMPRTCSDCEWSYYVGNGRAMCRRVSKTDKTGKHYDIAGILEEMRK